MGHPLLCEIQRRLFSDQRRTRRCERLLSLALSLGAVALWVLLLILEQWITGH